jgi:hypothetical protein
MHRRRPSSAVLATVVPAVLLLVVSGCVDMEVENPSAPDAALSDPAAVTALVDGAFHDWTLRPYGTVPGMSLAVGAEMFTSPWGNWSMRLLWAYPRRAWPNDLGTQGVHGATWDGLYNGLRAAGDVMWALEREVVEFGPDDRDRAAVHAFARLIQGLNLAWIALYFDQGFILDETVDVERDGLELVPYGEVFEVGMRQPMPSRSRGRTSRGVVQRAHRA